MPSDKVFCKSIKAAIQNGNIHELQRLVRQGKKINEIDSKFNFSPLHWASHYGSLECMHWLLWHGAEVDKQTEIEGWTAAHIAAIRGRDACIQALISNSANLDIQDKKGKTVGHLAASHGNANTLQEILRTGHELETRDNASWTIAHSASYHGRLACLQIAQKWGCDLKSLDDNGNTLVHLAASEGHLSCLKFIISAADNLGFIVHGTNDQGETAKDLAVQFFKDDCVSYLTQIEYDASHNEKAEDFTHPAHRAAYKGDLEYLRSLIETGAASVNERDEHLSTPAHKAAGNGQVEVLKWLIENGADLTAVNEAHEVPKDVAVRFGQLACIKLLGGDSDDDLYNEGEEVIVEKPMLNVDSKDRAKSKVEELYRQLEIAKLNYQQLGGILKEDKARKKEQQDHSRIVNSLEQQLQYEREKREKLESQIDNLRVHAHNLKIELEDLKEQLILAREIAVGEKLTEEPLKRQKRHKRKKQRPGIFLVRTPIEKNVCTKAVRPSTAVNKQNNVNPRPPVRPKTAVSRISESDLLNQSRDSLRSLYTRSSLSSRSSHSTRSENTLKEDDTLIEEENSTSESESSYISV